MANLLDLPVDIISTIFANFERVPLDQPPEFGLSFQSQWAGLPAIQACRLTCRALNELVSGMLCPLFRGRLDKKTMERIERLSRKAVIAKGVRVVQLDFASRPNPIAMDLRRYYDFVTDKIDKDRSRCEYHTEFQVQSPAALQHRALLEASQKLWLIRESWRQVVEPDTKAYAVADASYQQLFKDCFAEYSLKQRDEEDITSDGSFVNTIASAISRLENLSCLGFVDSLNGLSIEPESIANDMNILSR